MHVRVRTTAAQAAKVRPSDDTKDEIAVREFVRVSTCVCAMWT